MDITIRKIETEDIRGFRLVLSNVASEKKYLATMKAPPFESVQKFVNDNIQNNNAQYVAIDSEGVIGWADIVPINRVGMEHVGSLGMGLLSEYRGKGIGNLLLTKTIKHAWENDLKRLELEVFSDNLSAISLYKKHGYVEEGVKRYSRYIDNYFQDIVIMAQCRV